MDKKNSGVGVLDKAVYILATLESGPHSLAELVAATGIARPTAHRLAVALEFHHLVARDLNGRFIIGPRSGELAAAAGEDRLIAVATPALAALRDATGESAQLYRRQGDIRICVAVAERLSGLRDSVPIGASLTMQAGSAAQILSEFAKVKLETEFAAKAYISALASLEAARLHVQKQALFLEAFDKPHLPDSAEYPRRFANTLLVFVVSLLVWGIGGLLVAAAREHI